MYPWLLRSALILLTLSLLGAPVRAQLLPPPPPPPPSINDVLAKLDPLLIDELQNLDGQLYVIVRAQNAQDLSTITSLTTVLGGTLGRPLPILTARAVRLPKLSVLLLALYS